MQHYKMNEQHNPEEVRRLIADLSTCLLLTQSKAGEIQTGVFNPLFVDGVFYLHLHRGDAQVAAMRAGSPAKLVFNDTLALIPSYWVDARDGGVATTYYRYAEISCTSRLLEDAGDIAGVLGTMMKQYQPEGHYDPIVSDAAIYRKSFATILVVELKPTHTVTKWKIGQNRDVETRRHVVERLRERNEGNDKRAADEIERWMTQHAGT